MDSKELIGTNLIQNVSPQFGREIVDSLDGEYLNMWGTMNILLYFQCYLCKERKRAYSNLYHSRMNDYNGLKYCCECVQSCKMDLNCEKESLQLRKFGWYTMLNCLKKINIYLPNEIILLLSYYTFKHNLLILENKFKKLL